MNGNLERYGFANYQDNSEYKTGIIGKMHVDIYSNDDYMLLGRIVANNVKFVRRNGRIVFTDESGITIMNLLLDKIREGKMKLHDNKCEEHVFVVDGICYKMVAHCCSTIKMHNGKLFKFSDNKC